jgi:hypothetical protein
MAPSAIGERVQWQARATPSGPIRFAIPRRSGCLASMSMSAPVTVARRYKPPSFSTGALPCQRFSAISPSPPSQSPRVRRALHTLHVGRALRMGGRDLLGRNWPRRLWAEGEGAQRADRRARGESDPRFALRPRIRRRSAADRCEIWALVPIDCFALWRDYGRLHVKELRPFQEIRGYYSYISLMNFMFTSEYPSSGTIHPRPEAALRGETQCLGHTQNLQFRQR